MPSHRQKAMLRIRDVLPWFEFFHQGPGFRIQIKELTQTIVFNSRKYDPGCSCRIRIFTHPGSRIQGSKRHRIPDPGSGSETLPEGIDNNCMSRERRIT